MTNEVMKMDKNYYSLLKIGIGINKDCIEHNTLILKSLLENPEKWEKKEILAELIKQNIAIFRHNIQLYEFLMDKPTGLLGSKKKQIVHRISKD